MSGEASSPASERPSEPWAQTEHPAPHASWRRLHPLSPIARFGAILVPILVTVSQQAAPQPGESHSHQLEIDLGVALLAILAGVVSWLVTRWRIDGDDLQIETGLVRRQSLRVPLQRIQAVDVVRPLLARLTGLAEVRVVVAGGGRGHGKLAYLGEEQAWAVRAQLLALAHGLAAETPEAPEQPLWMVRNGRLAGSAALSGGAFVLLASVLVLLVAVAGGLPIATVFAVDFPLLVAVGAAVFRRFSAEFEFAIAMSPDGLRFKAGLLQTRAETVPLGRIQGVRMVQPLLWRLFGWQRLELDVARQTGAKREASEAVVRALCPVGTEQEVAWLLACALPGASAQLPEHAKAPRRALVRAPLTYWSLAAAHGERYVVARAGRTRWRTTVIPLEKVQSIRWKQGPLQRWLRLATVDVDTAGRGWRAAALHRDVDEAQALVEALAAAARSARARTT